LSAASDFLNADTFKLFLTTPVQLSQAWHFIQYRPCIVSRTDHRPLLTIAKVPLWTYSVLSNASHMKSCKYCVCWLRTTLSRSASISQVVRVTFLSLRRAPLVRLSLKNGLKWWGHRTWLKHRSLLPPGTSHV